MHYLKETLSLEAYISVTLWLLWKTKVKSSAYLKQSKSKQSCETRQDLKPELQSWVKLINKIGNK